MKRGGFGANRRRYGSLMPQEIDRQVYLSPASLRKVLAGGYSLGEFKQGEDEEGMNR
jgi:hypothetical protein